MLEKKSNISSSISPYSIDDPDQHLSVSQTNSSRIGAGLSISGTLHTDHDLHIDGNINGEINAKVLTIGEGATIDANIIAQEVVVSGAVSGSIRSVKLRLTNTAVVKGEIIQRLLAIEHGARFDGNVRRCEDPIEERDTQQDQRWNSEEATEVMYPNSSEDPDESSQIDPDTTEGHEWQ